MDKKKLTTIIIVVFALGAFIWLGLAGYFFWTIQDNGKTEKITVEVQQIEVEPEEPSEEESEETVSIEIEEEPEIDWETLTSQNPDIYAYVYVPGTKVSYPILQNEQDDFYLTHDANKAKSKEGAIYTNHDNTKTFQDAVTVLYGHNMRNGNMFGSLKEFYQEDFYKEHEYIAIYTPEKRLVYQIVTARRHSDAYLYDEYANYNVGGMERFVKMITEPVKDKDVSHATELEVSVEDKFLVLSVCIGKEDTNRYLVVGKLLKEE